MTAAAALVEPVPGEPWVPAAADVAALGDAGRALVADVAGRYELAIIEGRVLLEAARATDVLTTLRAEPADAARLRLEHTWSRHFAALLGQLQVKP